MELMEKIASYVIQGKDKKDGSYPPHMKGEDGVFELVRDALAGGVDPNVILTQGLVKGMEAIGKQFSAGDVFVPDLLMAAKAMTAGLEQLRPSFESGAVSRRGVFVVGTVQGDLHDIGKNLVRMMMEGAGYEVIDLGTDVSPETFLATVQENPQCAVGLSALLTTTMVNMEATTKLIKEHSPHTLVAIGGAPIDAKFCERIGADIFSEDPQGLIEELNRREAC